jgi:hypothetical protein
LRPACSNHGQNIRFGQYELAQVIFSRFLSSSFAHSNAFFSVARVP